MSSIRKESEFEEAITLFKTVLRLFKVPIHYKQLSEHMTLHYAGKRTFFRSLMDSEKISFFVEQSKFFRIESTGFVTSVEVEIIKGFTELLKHSTPQHFSTLIHNVPNANTYFSQSYDSERLEFFKHHTQHFSIRKNKYVELTDADVVTETIFDVNETSLLHFLRDHLKSFGPMYFFWLLDYVKSSEYYSGLIANEPHTEDQLWNFLQSHVSDFVISDCGFVDLSPHLKSKVEVDVSISGKDDDVIGFFIAKLAFFGCLSYIVLLKMLQDSALNIRCFFAKYSLNDVRVFFVKHSTVFVLRGKHVSMLRTVSLEGLITFNFHSYPFEDMKEIVFFFLDCLKMECPKHYIDLSEMLEKSNIETDFKYALLESLEGIKCVLQSYVNVFCIEENGYVSLHSPFELRDNRKYAIHHFIKKLQKSPIENFWTLIKSAEAFSEEFEEYFADFSPMDKFNFFKIFPTVFNINSDGYVSSEVSLDGFTEVEVIDVLVKHLNKFQPMHFEKLFLFMECTSQVSKAFFKSFKASQKLIFLKNRPEFFSINSGGFVSIPSSSCDFELKKSIPHTQSVQNSSNVLVSKIDESTRLISDTGPNNQKDLNGHSTSDSNIGCDKMESNTNFSIHEGTLHLEEQYREVKGLNKQELDTTIPSGNNPKLMLETLNTSVEIKDGCNDGSISTTKPFMTLSSPSNLSLDELEETHGADQVIKFLCDSVKLYKRIHFEKLCADVEHWDSEFANYFSSYSVDQKYSFFKNRKKYFSVDNNGYLCFPHNSPNNNCNLALSTNSLKVNENQIKSTLTSSLVEQCITNRAENNMLNLKSTSSCITEEQPALRSLPCMTSNRNDALKKQSLPSQEHTSGLHNLRNADEIYRKDDIIGILEYYLNIHKRMHYLKLCKTADYYFQSFSDHQKYQFFKDLSEHFCIGIDNFVTLSCDANGNLSIYEAKDDDGIIKILVNMLKKEESVHYEKLCNTDETAVTYFKSFTTDERYEFFKNQPKDFSISWRGDVSLSESVAKSKNSVAHCKNVASKSDSISRSLNFINKKTTSKSSVLTRDGQKSSKSLNVKCTVSNSRINESEFPIERVVSRKDGVMILSNQHISDFNQACANDITSSIKEADVIGIFKDYLKGCKSIYYQDYCLYVEKPNEKVKYNISKPLIGFQCEIIETLTDQLKMGKCVHFLELYQSSEELNTTVQNFFYFLSNSDRLDFLKSCPQYFSVDSDDFVTLSSSAENLLSISVPYKELYESNSCSNVHEDQDKQSQDLANDNDVAAAGKCKMQPHDEKSFTCSLPVNSTKEKPCVLPLTSSSANEIVSQDSNITELPNSGRERHMESINEKGLNAAAAACVNPAKETVVKTETGLMDVHLYDASTLLVDHEQEIIETLLAVLKINKCLDFSKLCKSSEEHNGICKRFFHFFSDTGRLGFLKYYPQYFVVGDDNFVTLPNTTQSFSNNFFPSTKSSKSKACSNNRDVAHRQHQKKSNRNDVFTVGQGITPPHNEKISNCNLRPNSTKAKHCTVPSTHSSANKIASQDSNTKELLSFFQTALCDIHILHFEELFKMLKESNKFENYGTLAKKSSMLKFFEDHPDIFSIHSRGFISLTPDAKSAQTKNLSTESTYK